MLESFESERTDGTLARPWGDDPLGMIIWYRTGHFAVQVGPRQALPSVAFTSFFGTAHTEDNDESGTIVLRIDGSSAPDRVNGDQVRNFLFLESDRLRMRPPVNPDGSQSTFIWRRAPAVA